MSTTIDTLWAEGRIKHGPDGFPVPDESTGVLLNWLCVLLLISGVGAPIGLIVCFFAMREWARVRRAGEICRTVRVLAQPS